MWTLDLAADGTLPVAGCALLGNTIGPPGPVELPTVGWATATATVWLAR
ncbi:MAG: hypothetical protein ABI693_15845 [Bryobacteraceae bacterium]